MLMFFTSFRGTKSLSIPVRSNRFEMLENRRLLSASSTAADVLDLQTQQAASPTFLVAQSVALTKIEGTFAGHYVSPVIGKNTLTITSTHDTHTGHFIGGVVIQTT